MQQNRHKCQILEWAPLNRTPGTTSEMVGKGRAPTALTKAQIIEMIAEQNGFAKNKSTELVETLIEIIKRALVSGEVVLVSGFDKFCVKSKGQRRGRNPAIGFDLMLSARKVVTFKCSVKLGEKVNR